MQAIARGNFAMHAVTRSRHWQCLCWLLAAACAGSLLLPSAATAQAALTAADRADIEAFTFNTAVFHRLQAVVEQARGMAIQRSQLDMSQVHSLDDMANQLVAADPRIRTLLAQHGFTPRQFLVANLALVSTVVTLEQAAGTPQEQAVEARLNPANVRFYKAHKAAMEALVHMHLSVSPAPPDQ